MRAHEQPVCTATSTAPETPCTAAGANEPSIGVAPSCPSSSAPQHVTVPASWRKQAWSEATAICRAEPGPAPSIGVAVGFRMSGSPTKSVPL